MNLYRRADAIPERSSAIALGCFDGLHRGHQSVVHGAVEGKKAGLFPAVFTFESHSMKTLHAGTAPEIMTFSDKAAVLSEWGVEGLFLEQFEAIKTLSPETFVREILHKKYHARQLFCGFNYRFGALTAGSPDDLKRLGTQYGMEVHVCDAVTEGDRPISSTWLRELILAGDMERTRVLLGRPFRYDFTVVKGNQIGRLMGTPTINQLFEGDFILPRFGVYASSVFQGGIHRHAVTNIGMRPTVRSDVPLSETWIPNFSGDLYDQAVRVSLHRFLRPEKKFSSMEELKAAILADGEQAENILRQIER